MLSEIANLQILLCSALLCLGLAMIPACDRKTKQNAGPDLESRVEQSRVE